MRFPFSSSACDFFFDLPFSIPCDFLALLTDCLAAICLICLPRRNLPTSPPSSSSTPQICLAA
ncbi:hypothetical protein ACLOJK_041720, partial [Asimina triloba]